MENEIIELYNLGETFTDIGKKYGISRKQVVKILKKLGVYDVNKRRKHEVNKQDIIKFSEDIIDMWNKGINSPKIAEIYNCNKSTIISILKERNIDTTRKSYNFKRYEYRDTYFNEIDTERKAYWLGLIASDGCVDKNNNITFSQKICDYDLVKELRNDICISEVPLKIIKQICNGKEHEYVNLNICSSYMGKRLRAIGVTNHKSYDLDILNLVNNIPEYLHRHFIRGYFDGDGSVGIYKQTHYDKPLYNLSIVGTYATLEWIKEKLDLDTVIMKDKRTVNNYSLKTGCLNDIKRIRDYFYDESTICMKRKYEIFYRL